MATKTTNTVLLTLTAVFFLAEDGSAQDRAARRKQTISQFSAYSALLNKQSKALSPAKTLEDLNQLPPLRNSGSNTGSLNPDEQAWLLENAKRRADQNQAFLNQARALRAERQRALRKQRRQRKQPRYFGGHSSFYGSQPLFRRY